MLGFITLRRSAILVTAAVVPATIACWTAGSAAFVNPPKADATAASKEKPSTPADPVLRLIVTRVHREQHDGLKILFADAALFNDSDKTLRLPNSSLFWALRKLVLIDEDRAEWRIEVNGRQFHDFFGSTRLVGAKDALLLSTGGLGKATLRNSAGVEWDWSKQRAATWKLAVREVAAETTRRDEVLSVRIEGAKNEIVVEADQQGPQPSARQ